MNYSIVFQYVYPLLNFEQIYNLSKSCKQLYKYYWKDENNPNNLIQKAYNLYKIDLRRINTWHIEDEKCDNSKYRALELFFTMKKSSLSLLCGYNYMYLWKSFASNNGILEDEFMNIYGRK